MKKPGATDFDREYAAEQLRRASHPLRGFIKRFYLRNILRDVRGATIDFGCGGGQLLSRLPAGSVGLEINPHLIEALRNSGHTVQLSRGDMHDFELDGVEPGRFRTLVIAHVLEHLADPAAALRVLLVACNRLAIERVIVVVPGEKGFAADRTHKTFIDLAYLESKFLGQVENFRLAGGTFFPGPWEWVGRYFVFHELKVVFDRQSERQV